jgi:ligand-binding sensor domain-containing protein
VQAPPRHANNQHFKANLTTEMDPGVLSILHDQNGYYWFGTNEGAYRYDGQSLIVFTTKDGFYQNQVQHIQEDAKGDIWFSTGGYGVNRFNGESISTFTTPGSNSVRRTLEIDWSSPKDALWFYAGGGVFQFDRDSFRYLPFPEAKSGTLDPYKASAYGVYTILKDRSGVLWMGTQALGVCRFDGTTFTWFTEYGLKGPAVLDLFEDSRGHFWFGTNGNGVFHYDGNRLNNVTEEHGLSNPDFIKNGKQGPGTLARVWAINEDVAGNMWFGTPDAGVWQHDGKELTNYTTRDGLSTKAIEVIYRDKNGELWFGTNGDGVYRFNGTRFSKNTF